MVGDIAAAVTYGGRAELSPRTTGTAWVAARKAVLATADDRHPKHGMRMGALAGPAARV